MGGKGDDSSGGQQYYSPGPPVAAQQVDVSRQAAQQNATPIPAPKYDQPKDSAMLRQDKPPPGTVETMKPLGDVLGESINPNNFVTKEDFEKYRAGANQPRIDMNTGAGLGSS